MNDKRNFQETCRHPHRQADEASLRKHHIWPPVMKLKITIDKCNHAQKPITDLRQHYRWPQQLAPKRQCMIASQLTGVDSRQGNARTKMPNDTACLLRGFTVTPKAHLGVWWSC